MEKKQRECDHSYGVDLGDDGWELRDKPYYGYRVNPMSQIPFNFCPFCAKDVYNSTPMQDPNEDDCQKGGCAD